jgi:glycosyltransferase involved in cell wall biosynthesis
VASEPRSPALDLKPRILELGIFSLFKRGLPEQTTLIWSGKRIGDVPLADCEPLSMARVRRLRHDLAYGAYDIIFCYPPVLPPWREARTREALARRLLFHIVLRHPMLTRSVPLAVLDYGDRSPVPRHNHHLLKRASWYFKRELPVSPENLLMGTTPWFDTADSVLQSRLYRENRHKLIPASLGIPYERLADVPEKPTEKTTDVFFSGGLNSEIRRRGFPELLELARAGIKIDVPPARLPRKEFYERCARAWLVWSPEGFGWDCFRHYEAAVCRSVPVINRPRIIWHRPLEEGVHCFFYAPSAGMLASVVKEALSDKERLRRMAEAGREHVLRYQTPKAICEYILSKCAPALRPDSKGSA